MSNTILSNTILSNTILNSSAHIPYFFPKWVDIPQCYRTVILKQYVTDV
ncbi:hypothetical protein ACSAZL_12310 [Methanosarcina sp. T3]